MPRSRIRGIIKGEERDLPKVCVGTGSRSRKTPVALIKKKKFRLRWWLGIPGRTGATSRRTAKHGADARPIHGTPLWAQWRLVILVLVTAP